MMNEQSIDGYGNLQAGRDIYYNSTQTKPIPKFLTNSLSKITKKQFLYRDQQIKELKANINFALISGFGGVGKTAIARTLYHELEKEYKHIAWIYYSENLKQSILAQTQRRVCEELFCSLKSVVAI